MTKQEERSIEIKLRAVAAEAESLAEDLREGKLWEGDCAARLGNISGNLQSAIILAKNDRR